MNTQIYYTGEGEQAMTNCETLEPRIEEKFINATVEIFMEALKISHNERRIIKPLLENALDKEMNQRPYKDKQPGILQQYQAYVLDTASERIRDRFKIPENIKVNHGHASHAKYADFVDWIEHNYSKSDKIETEE